MLYTVGMMQLGQRGWAIIVSADPIGFKLDQFENRMIIS